MRIAIALIPVIVFLVFLLLLDSFKLVKVPILLLSIAWGMLSAIIAYFLNTWLVALTDPAPGVFQRYIAPAAEETVKMAFILLLIRGHRIGFMIDGAIYGFAIGAGFSLIENIWYLWGNPSSNLLMWTVRGFGTAIMHGGTVSIFAILMMQAFDRGKATWLSFLYAWLSIMVMHSFFNHFVLPPVGMMFFYLLVIALSEVIIFRYSERNLRNWLELEFDSEVKLLAMIRRGHFAETHAGQYIHSIKSRFSPMVVVDMLAYIALYLELSIKAKSRLMLKEAGLAIPKDASIRDQLSELKALERNIGITGTLAISPVLRISKKDLWKWSLLK